MATKASAAWVTLQTMSDLRSEAADGIAEAAQRWDGDLILLGSHGRGAFRRLLMGSVAAQLLSIATVPVLVLPLQAIGAGKRRGRSADRRYSGQTSSSIGTLTATTRISSGRPSRQ